MHQFSPGAQKSGFSPVSTLMPGMMPFELSTSTNGLPSLRGSNALDQGAPEWSTRGASPSFAHPRTCFLPARAARLFAQDPRPSPDVMPPVGIVADGSFWNRVSSKRIAPEM